MASVHQKQPAPSVITSSPGGTGGMGAGILASVVVVVAGAVFVSSALQPAPNKAAAINIRIQFFIAKLNVTLLPASAGKETGIPSDAGSLLHQLVAQGAETLHSVFGWLRGAQLARSALTFAARSLAALPSSPVEVQTMSFFWCA